MKDHRNKTAGSGWMVRLVVLFISGLAAMLSWVWWALIWEHSGKVWWHLAWMLPLSVVAGLQYRACDRLDYRAVTNVISLQGMAIALIAIMRSLTAIKQSPQQEHQPPPSNEQSYLPSSSLGDGAQRIHHLPSYPASPTRFVPLCDCRQYHSLPPSPPIARGTAYRYWTGRSSYSLFLHNVEILLHLPEGEASTVS